MNLNNATRDQLLTLHQQGRISDEVLLLYGISGELPDVDKYSKLSVSEKQSIWSERLALNLGTDWERKVSRVRLPVVFRGRSFGKANWRREGF